MSHMTAWFTPAWLVGVAVALAGCTESYLHVSPDFGQAVRQNQVAQVADPDAHYRGWPAPGSSGARSSLAQARYDHNLVIPPVSMTTSSVATSGGGGNGASGAASPNH